MSLPKINISALPDLPSQSGVYGSQSGNTPQVYEDVSIIVVMVYLYEVLGAD